MKYAVAHTCMVANYKKLWDELDVVPNRELRRHAKDCADPYYKDDLERRAAKLEAVRKLDPEAWEKAIREPGGRAHWTYSYTDFRFERSTTDVNDWLHPLAISTGWHDDPYDGLLVEMQSVGLYICAPDWLKIMCFKRMRGQ